MPELPEVEVVKRELEKIFAQRPQIVRVEFVRKDLRDPIPIRKIQAMVGARVMAVRRRAKYLLIETEKGGLLSHLGMTGTWRLAALGEEMAHDHIYVWLSSGERLAFRDPRRFGIFETYDLEKPQSHPRLQALGPEPLDEAFTGESLWQKLRNKKAPIKTALMDQKLVVGVGNIYASEALFQARIRPQKRSDRVSLQACQTLVGCIKSILSEAIVRGGSSISDFKGAKGERGSYQDSHLVYDRKGQACVVCGTIIKAQVLAGRSTFWCPRCQS